MKGEVFKGLATGIGIVVISVVACSGELPIQPFSKLTAEEFRQREDAQAELLEWSRRQPKTAMEELFRQSRVAGDPEVRERCLAILRELVYDEYLKDGEGYIGIRPGDEVVAVPGDPGARVGVRVMEVMLNSAADHAGLRANDVIVGLDGVIWRDGSAARLFTERIRGLKPKSRVTLKVLRNGDLMDLQVILGRRPLLADKPFLGDRAEDLEAVESAAKDAYFRRWLEARKARQ